MRALSVRQPWASLLFNGKLIETRTWPTKYRGPLLIVSSKRPANEGPAGVALGVVQLVDCRPMVEADEAQACCPVYPKAQAWVVEEPQAIQPFPVQGKLGIYEVDVEESDLVFLDQGAAHA